MIRRVALAIAVAASVVAAACSPTPEPVASRPPTTGEAADLASLRVQYGLPECPDTDPAAAPVPDGLPATALACLGTDQEVNLAGLPREPTIVNLWAQWCAPCREEAPFLREGLAELDGVNFVGVNYNDPKLDWAVEFAGLVGWIYPHVIDQDKTLQSQLRVPGLPTTYFIGEDGSIAGVHAGPFESTAQLRDLTAKYLGVE